MQFEVFEVPNVVFQQGLYGALVFQHERVGGAVFSQRNNVRGGYCLPAKSWNSRALSKDCIDAG